MVEEKAERTPAKATGKAIEAAMIARLFKDSLDSATPIVSTFVWDRDDGQRLDLGKIKPHPSFPSREVASKRLGEKIVQWVSGEKAGPDKNAVLRLDMGNSIIFDFSMESFEKAALADDGVLVVGVGESNGVEREPMGITRIARLRLFASDGSPVGRRQALMPIKELIHIHQKERESQALRLKNEEKQIDNGDFDHLESSGRLAKSAPGRNAASGNAPPLRRLAPPTETARAAPAAPASGMMERQMMQVALMEVSKNMSGSLKEAPIAPGPRPNPGPDVVVERIYAAALEGEGSRATQALSMPAEEATPHPVAEPTKAALATPKTDPAKGVASQVKVEKAAPKIDPEHVKAAFPDLPGGTDEIHITIERSRLAAALDALGGHAEFELRIASKGADLLSMGVCVPAGQVALLSDFVAAFAKGGVMIRRAPAKAA